MNNLQIGTVFAYNRYHCAPLERTLWYITKITKKQIQFKQCRLNRIHTNEPLPDGYYTYMANILPAPDSEKPMKMNIDKLEPYMFIDYDNAEFSMNRPVLRATDGGR